MCEALLSELLRRRQPVQAVSARARGLSQESVAPPGPARPHCLCYSVFGHSRSCGVCPACLTSGKLDDMRTGQFDYTSLHDCTTINGPLLINDKTFNATTKNATSVDTRCQCHTRIIRPITRLTFSIIAALSKIAVVEEVVEIYNTDFRNFSFLLPRLQRIAAKMADKSVQPALTFCCIVVC